MNVRLIAITASVIDECKSPNELIAYCARVSSPGNQANHDTAPRLLAYLARHGHWSPFEMASMVLEITTTRDVARQILRHRSFSFQEFSQRYAVAPVDAVLREVRLQDPTNRQSSLETNDVELRDWWECMQDEVIDLTLDLYLQAIQKGIAKEVARALLPEGLTPTTLCMAGTVRSWIHYCQLRTKPETQKEHRKIARVCQMVLLREFPALSVILEGES